VKYVIVKYILALERSAFVGAVSLSSSRKVKDVAFIAVNPPERFTEALEKPIAIDPRKSLSFADVKGSPPNKHAVASAVDGMVKFMEQVTILPTLVYVPALPVIDSDAPLASVTVHVPSS
jgi:xanthine dehydrogenase iron-sulfur cluster and FAD-binding subunit A